MAEEPPKLEEIVTDEVLESIIKGYNPDLSLVSWQAREGVNPGENFMSVIYAVELELKSKSKNGEAETLQVMLKTLPRSAPRAAMINNMRVFTTETVMYKDVLPTLVQVQKEKGVRNEELFSIWPQCYASHVDGQTDFLAMEDLKVSGFNMGSRIAGLDFYHCATVLRNLAKFHAISFAKYDGDLEKICSAFPQLRHVTSDAAREKQQMFFSQSFKNLSDVLTAMGEELACSRVKKLANADIAALISDLVGKNIEYAVIAHGDCWVNNILFKYGDEDSQLKWPTGAMFVDYQISKASSRLVDVFYFLIVSAKLGLLEEREEDLLMIYYSEFTSYAERLGVNTKAKGLTWQMFLMEAGHYRLYGVLTGLLLAPLFAAGADDIKEEDTKMSKNEEFSTIKKLHKNLTKGNTMQKVKSILLEQLPKCTNATKFL